MKRHISCAIVLALLGTACAGSTDDGVGTDEEMRVLPDAIRTLVDDVEPPQSQWLSDGRVTNAELEAAFLAALACIEDKGLDVDLEFRGAGDISITVRSTSEEGLERDQAAADACLEENYDLTALVYGILYGPTESERNEALQLFLDCAHDLGLRGWTYQEVMDDFRDQGGVFGLAACDEAREEYVRQVTIQRASAQQPSSGG